MRIKDIDGETMARYPRCEREITEMKARSCCADGVRVFRVRS